MNAGRIIAIFLILFALAMLAVIALGSFGNADGVIAIFFYGLPCSFFLLLIGVILFLFSDQPPKAKYQMLCPKCRYDMAGLSQTKCPECGAEFTIDQLKLK